MPIRPFLAASLAINGTQVLGLQEARMRMDYLEARGVLHESQREFLASVGAVFRSDDNSVETWSLEAQCLDYRQNRASDGLEIQVQLPVSGLTDTDTEQIAAYIKREICNRFVVDPRQLNVFCREACGRYEAFRPLEVLAAMPVFERGRLEVRHRLLQVDRRTIYTLQLARIVAPIATRLARDLELEQRSIDLRSTAHLWIDDSRGERHGQQFRDDIDRMRRLYEIRRGGLDDTGTLQDSSKPTAEQGSCALCAYYMPAPFNTCNALHNLPGEADLQRSQNCADWEAKTSEEDQPFDANRRLDGESVDRSDGRIPRLDANNRLDAYESLSRRLSGLL
jgi:hypothetical protein